MVPEWSISSTACLQRKRAQASDRPAGTGCQVEMKAELSKDIFPMCLIY